MKVQNVLHLTQLPLTRIILKIQPYFSNELFSIFSELPFENLEIRVIKNAKFGPFSGP